MITFAPPAPVTRPNEPGKLSAGPALGTPVTGAHTEAQDPVQVGGPPLLSFPKVYTTRPLAVPITQPRLECCTMRTVVPTAGNVTPALLLGWAWAVCLGDELEDVALAFAVDLGEDEDEDDVDEEAGPELDDDAVP